MRCGKGFDWDRRAKRIVGRSALVAVFVVGVDLKRRDLAGEQTPSLGIPIDFIAEQRLDGREFVVEGENVVLQLRAGVVVDLGGARLELVGDVCDRAGGFREQPTQQRDELAIPRGGGGSGQSLGLAGRIDGALMPVGDETNVAGGCVVRAGGSGSLIAAARERLGPVV